MEHYGYIYLTENLINGHKYIGQHHWEKSGIDKSYYGSGKLLHNAIRKYGKENFKVSLIQYCKTKLELDTCERFWITYFNATESPEFYNITNGGWGASGKYNPFYGKPRDKDTCAKISNTLKGHPVSDETRAKIAKASTGRHHSEETKRKMSESRSGPNNPFYGVPKSEEHRRKISETLKGKGHHHTKESKEKLSKASKGEKNASAKLTEENVLEIIYLHFTCGWSYTKIMEKFNVSKPTIGYICQGKTWSHVTGILYKPKS